MIENKNYIINLLILNEKDLWEISDFIQTIVVLIKTWIIKEYMISNMETY